MLYSKVYIFLQISFQEWYDGDGGKVKWQYDCDFPGNDAILEMQKLSENCVAAFTLTPTDAVTLVTLKESACHVKNTPSGTPRQQKSGLVCVYLSSARYIA